MGTSKCQKTTKLCDKRECKEATFYEIIVIHLHLIRCKSCREYSKKTQKLSSILQKASIKKMCPHIKQQLKTQFQEELNEAASQTRN
jgi:predicted anti-sigma-YlaC factor YlaD